MSAYATCFECRYSFATPEVLLAEHNAVIAELNEHVKPDGDAMWDITEPIPYETDPSRVTICPHCAHDF